jgi:ATP-dependent helicase HrpB
LALALAQWGTSDPSAIPLLDRPPEAAYAEAKALLARLGALDAKGQITQHGKAMAGLGLHPRLAHMVLTGKEKGLGATAAAIAALLMERDILRTSPRARDADLRLRVEMLGERGATRNLPAGITLDRGATERARQAARQIGQRLGIGGGEIESSETGRLLALAYPDRIAQKRPGARGQFLLANGKGAEMQPADALAGEDYLAVADLDGDKRVARIFLAAPISRVEIEEDFAGDITAEEIVEWDSRSAAVLARSRLRLGALALEDKPLASPDPALVTAAMIQGISELGLKALPWNREAEALRARISFLRRIEGEAWPDLSDDALMASLEDWLAPYLAGISRRTQLQNLDLAAALAAGLSHAQRQALDKLAPSHVTVPSGSRIAVDYSGEYPALAVKLQEMFGARETPAIAGGRAKLVIHLLSPAGRPLQVTSDLAGFWKNSYPQVRSEMRGRYPRHPWPENPLEAAPTKRTKRR